MSKHDLMTDPYFALLMFQIERVICKADKMAQEKGVRLTDSSIKSALNKARRLKPEQVTKLAEPPGKREEFVEELAHSIAAQRLLMEATECKEDEPTDVTVADWANAILATEASLKVRQSKEPGSREYLDFVRVFVEEAVSREFKRSV